MGISNNTQVVQVDPIRTVAHGSILSTYVAIGGPFTNPVRIICFTNNTDGDMFFSYDGVNDMLFVAAGGFKLFDLNTNRTNRDQYFCFPNNTQWYVRYNTSPSKNSVYLEALWGD